MKHLLLVLIGAFFHAEAIEPSQCIAPLGMENKGIKDEDITASSSFDHGNVGPHHGRVRTELNAGAWCPQTPATRDLKEWLQLDLHSVHLITAAETQGRFGNGHGVEFAEAYVLDYWRPRLAKWIRYRNRTGAEVFPGNINTYLESKSPLDPPIWASRLRFLPFSLHRRTVCMRVEAYGCRWPDGVAAYAMPQGDKRGPSWEFYDASYDGHWDGERLQGGLGQLTDGEVAADDFKAAFYEEGRQGWVGWKNDSRPGGAPVEIEFEFEGVREFSAVHVFANNQFSRDVQVFVQAKVYFSVGGKHYKGEPIVFDYIEDRIWETSRNVSIRLHHRVGRFVKLQLHFAARWILISEVTFDSTPLSGNHTVEEEPAPAPPAAAPTARPKAPGPADGKAVSAVNTPSSFGPYLGVIVGVLAVLVFLMVAVVVFVVVQQRRYKSSPRPSRVPDKAALYREPSVGRGAGEYADARDPEYAVPLQQAQQRAGPPPLLNFFPKPPPVPPPPERYYAATEICNAGFVPPPPPLSTPPPVRLGRQPRYVSNTRTYVGP